MSVQTRNRYLKNLVGNPSGHKAIMTELDSGPEVTREVSVFLNIARGNPETAIGNNVTMVDPKYKYMSIYSGQGRSADSGHTYPSLYYFTKEVEDFFRKLFERVSDASKHPLSKYDLWHGHFVRYDDGTDFCIVFHAKEYPKDLRLELSGPFSSEDSACRYRNILWKRSGNRIYQIDAGWYSLSQKKLLSPNQFFDEIIDDFAKERVALYRSFAAPNPEQAGNDVRAARTLPQEELGYNSIDLFYLMDEQPNPRIVMKKMGLLAEGLPKV